MTGKKRLFNADEACRLGDRIGVDWSKVELDEFRRGLVVERAHVARFRIPGRTVDPLTTTAKIAWARLRRVPDYYTRSAGEIR
jgi:hypothetical protein